MPTIASALPDLILFALVGASGLLLWTRGFSTYFAARRLKRSLRAHPLTSIADAPEDQDVRIRGTLEYVEGTAPLTAPISGRPCAAWHVVIAEIGRDGEQRWRKIVAEQSRSANFIVRDATGDARVEGTKLTLALTVDSQANDDGAHGIGLHQRKPEAIRAFLRERGTQFHKKSSFRYEEAILEAGETVTVAGHGTWQRDPSKIGEAGYRDVGRTLCIGPMSNGEILVSDDPKFAAL